MGKLFAQINMSVDGFVDRGPGDMDWSFVDEEFEAFINDTLASLDAMIFGRRAFELLQAYWPTAGDDPDASTQQRESAHWMNKLPKYVLSRSLTHFTWENAHVVRSFAEVQRLKERQSGKVALFAGAEAVRGALAAGVLDELRLILNPVVLGSGTPLWSAPSRPAPLATSAVRRFASGALLLTYLPGARDVVHREGPEPTSR